MLSLSQATERGGEPNRDIYARARRKRDHPPRREKLKRPDRGREGKTRGVSPQHYA